MKYLDRYYSTRAIKDHPFNIDTKCTYDAFIVIPAYNESFKVFSKTLDSLLQNEQSNHKILCLVLINYKSSDSNELINDSVQLSEHLEERYSDTTHPFLDIQFRHILLNHKKPGVGLARKILMDAAFEYYYNTGSDGIIVNLDADTTVEPNYFQSILDAFSEHQEVDAFSIDFNHQIYDLSDRNQEAAMMYELHLRYFINIQRYFRWPFAYQTIGSAMACRAFAYAKVGGMSQRQAGEDFYFMHKFSQIGKLRDLSTTTVHPSCRSSDRVPFGTGKAIKEIIAEEKIKYHSYHPASFRIIGNWILRVMRAYKKDNNFINFSKPEVLNYLVPRNMFGADELRELAQHSSNFKSFQKRFFQWYGPFKLMKSLHAIRDLDYPYPELEDCTEAFFSYKFIGVKNPGSLYDQLLWFRSYDKAQDYYEISKDYY